jgi:hypothetical protein
VDFRRRALSWSFSENEEVPGCDFGVEVWLWAFRLEVLAESRGVE